MSVVNLADLRPEHRAAAVATAVLVDLAVIQDRLIGYFQCRRRLSRDRCRAGRSWPVMRARGAA